MNSLFRIEVDTGSGGYGWDDTLEEMLADITSDFSVDTAARVRKWAVNSKSGDQFVGGGLYIVNISDEVEDAEAEVNTFSESRSTNYFSSQEHFKIDDTVIVSRRIEKDQECFEPGTVVYIVNVSDKGYDIRDHRGTQINEIDFDCVQSQKSDCKRWYTMHLHAEESFQGNVLLTPKEASIVADAITQLYANGTGGSWCGSVSIDTSRYRFDKFDYGEDDDEDWD